MLFCNRNGVCLLRGTKWVLTMIQVRVTWSNSGMILTGESRSARRKTCPSATLSTTNLIWTLTAEARFRSQASPSETYGGQSGIGTGFSPSNSVFHWQCHSTNAAHSSSSICRSHWEGRKCERSLGFQKTLFFQKSRRIR